MQALESREDLTCYQVDCVNDLDLTKLSDVMREAWAKDYTDELRPDFNENYLAHALAGSHWIAVVVLDGADQPVAFELALERQLFCRGERLNAYYATLFTVSVNHRRRGIGRWVLQTINELAFKTHSADLLFSIFHRGHSGSPTVQATFDAIPDWAVNRFHETKGWGRRIDKDPLPAVNERMSIARVIWPPAEHEWRTVKVMGDVVVPDSQSFREAIRNRYDVAFDISAGFRSTYLDEDGSHAGLLWYRFGEDACCALTYSVMPLAVNDRKLRPVGMIQGLHAENVSDEQIQQVLIHFMHYLLGLGCFAMSIYDLGVVSHEVLREVGLAPDEMYNDYAVRGPKNVLAPFVDVKPPYFMDLT